MIAQPEILIDDRDVTRIIEALRKRRLGYVPEWRPDEQGPDAALMQIFARYLHTILQRLNQAPDKNKLAFLDLLGLDLTPAQAARAPIVFEPARENEDAIKEALKNLKGHVPVPDEEVLLRNFDSFAPAGTQVAAQPPPGETNLIVFETERDMGIASGRLEKVASLLPAQDKYADHSQAFQAGKPVQLFNPLELQLTPHAIYLAHDDLLELAGNTTLTAEFELKEATAKKLEISWAYWNGSRWSALVLENDSTLGFRQSGSIKLTAGRAEAVETKVNGLEAFWIRGELLGPLLSSKNLPQVEKLQLSATNTQPLVETSSEIAGFHPDKFHLLIEGVVRDEAGEPFIGVDVNITISDDPDFKEPIPLKTSSRGTYSHKFEQGQGPKPKTKFEVQISLYGFEFSHKDEFSEKGQHIEIDSILKGVPLDKAFADEGRRDLSKPFYPFGRQPEPGATFYFKQKAALRPGAKAQIYVETTLESINLALLPPPLAHTVCWEYFDGRMWKCLLRSSESFGPALLNMSGIIELVLPADMEKISVQDDNDWWMRVRLVSGEFGFEPSTQFGGAIFPRITPPVVVDCRIGYTWHSATEAPEQILTFNDFQYEDHIDHTSDVPSRQKPFPLFKPVSDATPAFYLGFDKKLLDKNIGIYFDIAESLGKLQSPDMVWEYWNGEVWEELGVEDETCSLRVPGILSFIAPADSKRLARFGAEAEHWIRGRLLEEGGSLRTLTINKIFLNAVWASQHRTQNDTALGTSSGVANQVLRIMQTPVLAGERMEVRELAGPRADVEWRILAQKLNPNLIPELEELLSRASPRTGTELTSGDLRLRLGPNERVTEAWVRWEGQQHLFFSGPEDRHYMIDRANGRFFFGDGVYGKIPPASALIMAKQFRYGGGRAGNVAAGDINQLLSGIPGIEKAFNPRPAEGGANSETPRSFSERGPQTLSHRGRAITASDYVTMAYEASSAVAVARVMPNYNGAGGSVRLMIIPHSRNQREPQPSFGLREQVRKFIVSRAPLDLAQADQIHIVGPNYLPIEVTATIAPVDPAEAGAVERRGREALAGFFHPLHGGPERRGWEPSRDVFISDVAAVLERVEGVDYVEQLALSLDGLPAGETVAVPDNRIVAAGKIRLKMKAATE